MLYGDISARLGPDVAIIDSYEDQDLAEYTLDTSAYDITQAFVTDGAYGLEYSPAADNEIRSFSGLDNYPSQGDVFEFDFTIDTGSADTGTFCRCEWEFGIDSGNPSNRYYINLNIDGSNLELWENSAGSRFAVDFGVDYVANTHYSVEVVWDDGTLGGSAGDFTVTLTDEDTDTQVSQITGNDTTHTGGGIGKSLDNAEGAVWNWDFARITN